MEFSIIRWLLMLIPDYRDMSAKVTELERDNEIVVRERQRLEGEVAGMGRSLASLKQRIEITLHVPQQDAPVAEWGSTDSAALKADGLLEAKQVFREAWTTSNKQS